VYEVWANTHRVWVASVADGRGVPLDTASPDEHSPAWSPDGNWIVYQRLSGAGWELVKVPSGGGAPVHLGAATPGGGDHTAWSPAGRWIAHVVTGELRLTSADGTGAERTLEGSPPAAFGFSSDGSRLYTVSRSSSGGWALVTFDVERGEITKRTQLELPSTAAMTGFSLNPDGKSFATAIGVPRHDIWLLEGFEPVPR
jgi:Tol biopolymer transport system component